VASNTWSYANAVTSAVSDSDMTSFVTSFVVSVTSSVVSDPPLSNLEWPAILGAMGLGFCLSLLIFMDHNIAGAMVNSPDNG